MPQCKGTNKDGSDCGRQATAGSEFCSAHEPEVSVCEHVNKHFIQSQPDQPECVCEKEPNHEGLHGALVHVKLYDREGNLMEDDWKWQEWSDIAGIPADEIVPEQKGKTRFDVYDEAWQPVN